MAAPYASIQDMETRYGTAHLEIFVGDITAEHVNAQLSEFLNETSDLIESYCRQAGYLVPLSSTPGIIKALCMVITYFNLYVLKPERTPNAYVTKQYEDAMAWLKDLADGKVQLDVSTNPTQETERVPEYGLDADDMEMTDGKDDDDYNELGNFKLHRG